MNSKINNILFKKIVKKYEIFVAGSTVCNICDVIVLTINERIYVLYNHCSLGMFSTQEYFVYDKPFQCP